MAVYVNITVRATVKIQDPYDETTLQHLEEQTKLDCPFELLYEDYQYEVADAD